MEDDYRKRIEEIRQQIQRMLHAHMETTAQIFQYDRDLKQRAFEHIEQAHVHLKRAHELIEEAHRSHGSSS